MRPDQMQDRILELEDENYFLRRQIANFEGQDKSIEERICDIIEELGFKRG